MLFRESPIYAAFGGHRFERFAPLRWFAANNRQNIRDNRFGFGEIGMGQQAGIDPGGVYGIDPLENDDMFARFSSAWIGVKITRGQQCLVVGGHIECDIVRCLKHFGGDMVLENTGADIGSGQNDFLETLFEFWRFGNQRGHRAGKSAAAHAMGNEIDVFGIRLLDKISQKLFDVFLCPQNIIFVGGIARKLSG